MPRLGLTHEHDIDFHTGHTLSDVGDAAGQRCFRAGNNDASDDPAA
ncbi:MAG TPA: hypothetical protein VN723_12085 [Rhizomicrobium sp.]|jgi:hypothetical protein|nr:hypothetical protein [Rhizomicrobium sp.]